MRPIPLAPLRPTDEAGPDPDEGPEGEGRQQPRRRPGRLRRAARYFGSPFGAWAGSGAIRSSAWFIGESLKEVRAASRRDPRFRLFPDGEFDLEATTFLYGISHSEMERRLARRRRHSAYMAYVCAVLAVGSCAGWIGRVFGSPADAGTVMLTLNAIGFGVICVLGAFYQALINFQLRSRRAVGWKEYLMTERGFWPIP